MYHLYASFRRKTNPCEHMFRPLYLTGVTHALRTSEYRDREAQYRWVQKLMGHNARFHNLGLFSFELRLYDAFQAKATVGFVDEGYADGWDDPKVPNSTGHEATWFADGSLERVHPDARCKP